MAKEHNPKLKYTNLAGKEAHGKLLDLPLDQVKSLTVHGFGGKGFKLYEWPNQLREMPHLESLDLTSCPLRTLPPWLGELPQLRSLHLSDTKIQTLPALLASLPQLTKFGFMEDGCDHEQVCSVLAQCPHLTKLLFRDDKMTHAPPSLFECRSLTELHLRSTVLREIPPAIGQLTQLTLLVIGSALAELPAEIGQLTALESLEFDWSRKVSAIPASYTQLTQLKKFVLNSAKIKALPATWTNLTHLEELRLRGNKIKEFPGDISLMPRLRVLDLGCNELTALPQGIEALQELVDVDFAWNKDETLHQQCMETCHVVQEEMFIRGPLTEKEKQLSNPRKVIVKWEQGDIPDDMFTWLGTRHNMESLEFTRSLSHLPASLMQLTSLQTLLLYELGECHLPESIAGLHSLKVLRATSRTKVPSLPSAIASLHKLEELSIHLNDASTFNAPAQLITLSLHLDDSNDSELADVFDRCTQLETMTLLSRTLTTLPPSMAALQSMTELNLTVGDVFDWEQAISILVQLTSLRKLEVRHFHDRSKVPSMPDAIASLTQLIVLDLFDVSPEETDVPDLSAMVSLRSILFAGEGVTSADKKKLKKQLPNQGKGWRQVQHTKGYGGMLAYGRELG